MALTGRLATPARTIPATAIGIILGGLVALFVNICNFPFHFGNGYGKAESFSDLGPEISVLRLQISDLRFEISDLDNSGRVRAHDHPCFRAISGSETESGFFATTGKRIIARDRLGRG